MIETYLFSLLSSSAGITAITGPRIYPLLLPTDVAMPAIHYSFVGTSSKSTADTTGSQRYRVEVNSWGKTYLDAVTLRSAVIGALHTYNDGYVNIQLLSEQDLFDHELEEYRAIAEFYAYANIGTVPASAP